VTTRRYLVSGRVQGVGFRWWVRHRAMDLALGGWVRNLPDGRVEIMAGGEEDALIVLEDGLQHGPRFARVEIVEKIEIQDEVTPHISFDVK
jgi:acylphosphatase